MIAAISNTGTLRFRVFDERFTGPLFLDFLKRLVKDNKGRKIMLILDGHPAHRARIVRDWVAANRELIELHFLPGYSPELNPAEMLNQDVKTNALGRRRPLDIAELKAATRADIAEVEASLLRWMATMLVAQVGVLFALLKLFP